MPSENSDPSVPDQRPASSRAPADGPRTGHGFMRAGALALVAVGGVALAGWMIHAYLTRPQAAAPESMDGLGTAGPAPSPSPSDLSADHYNAVLQVRLKDEHGAQAAVGTVLARKLTLTLTDVEGRTYAEVFDRVGLWAIEVPPGAYVIPFEQPDLAHWKWLLTGDTLRTIAGKGYAVTFTAGRVNPTIDLLLQ